jgi:segregation and condensation protein B
MSRRHKTGKREHLAPQPAAGESAAHQESAVHEEAAAYGEAAVHDEAVAHEEAAGHEGAAAHEESAALPAGAVEAETAVMQPAVGAGSVGGEAAPAEGWLGLAMEEETGGAERAEMEAAIEAILFVSSEPVPRGKLVALFDEEQREQALAALDVVLARYGAGDGRGVMVEDVAGGVRLVTRPETGTWLRRFFEVAGGNKLSMAALETLAIVAYRQPITGPEIQELRSVSPAGVLRTLLEKRLVRIAGRKEVVGKPFLYATTREFLVHFGLNSLRDLPPLEEFEETFGAAAGAGGGGEGGAWAMGAAAAGGGEIGGGGGTLAGELAGEDREESILRQAAALDEREEDAAAAKEDGDAEVVRVPRAGPVRRAEAAPVERADEESEES